MKGFFDPLFFTPQQDTEVVLPIEQFLQTSEQLDKLHFQNEVLKRLLIKGLPFVSVTAKKSKEAKEWVEETLSALGDV